MAGSAAARPGEPEARTRERGTGTVWRIVQRVEHERGMKYHLTQR